MFRVGQKVVCVDDSPSYLGHPFPGKLETVYTVASLKETWEGLGLDLVEVPAPQMLGYFHLYRAERFRPVVERKTDISIFTRMLDPTNAPEVVS